jgi:DNA-nicking Smr family endonuclease
MKRRTTEEEKTLFRKHVDEVPPLKALKPKSSKPGHARSGGLAAALTPTRAKRTEGEVAVAALVARRREPERESKLRRPEGVTNSLDGNTAEKLRKGEITPGARIDLHGMTERAAHNALLSFLAAAQGRGVRLALVITGVGNPRDRDNAEWMRSRYGVLKGMVPRWLNEKDFTALVSGSGPAHRRHGGEGALYVYLRKRA